MTNENRLTGGLYRSRRGWIFGVCRGIGESRDISIGLLRLVVIILAIVTGFWPVILGYILAAIIMKPEPPTPFTGKQDREFYESYTGSRSLALARLKQTFDNLDRRTRRIETIVTGKEYDWDRRMKD